MPSTIPKGLKGSEIAGSWANEDGIQEKRKNKNRNLTINPNLKAEYPV
ncbi:hypothetical protein MASR2M15_09380 [Anaerolineales bacterium]